MSRPLFVHSDSKILNRLNQESNGTALVTTSMVEALKWVTTSSFHLSGIFINPEDTHFSALKFLEITLAHRPALPIFLFEPNLGTNPEQLEKIMKSTHIQGVFFGTEPYSVLMAPLKQNLEPTEFPRKSPPKAAIKPDLIALPITDFSYGSHYPYDLFTFDESERMALFAQKGSAIDANYLKSASEKVSFIYVKKEDFEKNRSTLNLTRTHYLESDLPNAWKTAETLSNTKQMLDEMREAGVNDDMVEYTKTMLGDLFKLISKIDSDEGSIHGMIEKAKQCDRSVFCASYSVLIAKHLRFEKNATLEILGLASVLQDLSLYRTPYGDLTGKLQSALNKEELAYYLKHPTLSADIVSGNTDIPQVTLQVVRQHHERKDRTGFPHRIGGNQLHPMAEILSLINAYYEVTKSVNDDVLVIQTLQKETFQHYSENVILAFKAVLSNILLDKANAAKKSG